MRHFILMTTSIALLAIACRTPASSASKPDGEAAEPPPLAATPAAEGGAEAEANTETEAEGGAEAEPDPSIDRPAPPPATAGARDLTGPLRFLPSEAGDGRLPADVTAMLDPDVGTMMDHPYDFGWSADSSRYGWCLVNGGAECDECTIVEVEGGATRTWTRGSECERTKDQGKAIARTWAEHGIGKQPVPTRWAFGRDLAIAWRTAPGKESEDGKTVRLAELRVGAKFEGERSVYFRSITEPRLKDVYVDYDIFPAAILPSPDGSHLAIMSHAFAGEYTDTIRVTLERTEQFALAAYLASGKALLDRDPRAAVERLTVATRIDPEAWEAFHHLACAHARAGKLAEAKEPLTRSIALGGAEASRRARRDPNLAAVREQAWFAEVVAPGK